MTQHLGGYALWPNSHTHNSKMTKLVSHQISGFSNVTWSIWNENKTHIFGWMRDAICEIVKQTDCVRNVLFIYFFFFTEELIYPSMQNRSQLLLHFGLWLNFSLRYLVHFFHFSLFCLPVWEDLIIFFLSLCPPVACLYHVVILVCVCEQNVKDRCRQRGERVHSYNVHIHFHEHTQHSSSNGNYLTVFSMETGLVLRVQTEIITSGTTHINTNTQTRTEPCTLCSVASKKWIFLSLFSSLPPLFFPPHLSFLFLFYFFLPWFFLVHYSVVQFFVYLLPNCCTEKWTPFKSRPLLRPLKSIKSPQITQKRNTWTVHTDTLFHLHPLSKWQGQYCGGQILVKAF